jgi:hypothetical protein
MRSPGQVSAREHAVIRRLVARVPGRFSSELGLNLESRRRRDLFLWIVASIPSA